MGILLWTNLDGVFALREVLLALLRLLQLPCGVLRRQAATDGAGLLGAEVEREVLLVLVEEAQVVSLLGVDDGEDAGDRLSEVVAADRTPTLAPMLLVYSNSSSSTRARSVTVSVDRMVGVLCVPCGVRVSAHILFSLVPEEAIFWMRSWPSSVFSSPRVLVSSSLFLDHSWPALILLEDCDIVSDSSEEEQSSIAVGW